MPNDYRVASRHGHVRICVTNTRVYMRLSSGRFYTCFVLSACSRVCVCVFNAAWLHIPDISFFAIHMGPSLTFLARFVVSAHSRVCSCVSQPPLGYIFRTFLSLQHIPSHTCVLSPTPTSAHASTVSITKFLLLISDNNAVHRVSRLVIPGNAGYPGLYKINHKQKSYSHSTKTNIKNLKHSPFSACAPDGHLPRVTIPDAVLIQFDVLRMSKILLETCTCRGV
jgi:hypothetical protein